MKTAYSLYENSLYENNFILIFFDINSLYISTYYYKCLGYKLQISCLSKQGLNESDLQDNNGLFHFIYIYRSNNTDIIF